MAPAEHLDIIREAALAQFAQLIAPSRIAAGTPAGLRRLVDRRNAIFVVVSPQYQLVGRRCARRAKSERTPKSHNGRLCAPYDAPT